MAVMTLKALLPIALLVTVAPAPASAQLPRRTFGGLPFWADSALVVSGLGRRFMLSSELNTIYEFGDFDGDGCSTSRFKSRIPAGGDTASPQWTAPRDPAQTAA